LQLIAWKYLSLKLPRMCVDSDVKLLLARFLTVLCEQVGTEAGSTGCSSSILTTESWLLLA